MNLAALAPLRLPPAALREAVEAALYFGVVPLPDLALDETHEHYAGEFEGVPHKGAKPTIAEFAMHHLKLGKGHAEVAALAQKAFGSKTTKESVAWYASKMKKEGTLVGKVASAPKDFSKMAKAAGPKAAPTGEAVAQKAEYIKGAIKAAGELKEADAIGGKYQSKMTPEEKSLAVAKAQAILDAPLAHTTTEVAAAHALSVYNAGVKSPLTEHEQAQQQAKAKAAGEKAASAPKAIPGNAHPEIPLLTPPPATAAQAAAAERYSASGASAMNNYLRGESKSLSSSDKEHMAQLDKALEASSTNRDVRLYRGIPTTAALAMFGSEIKEGLVFSDKGFASTSVVPNVAHSFSNGVVLHIDVPKGSKALDLRPHSQHAYESEVVLPRDQKLRVKSVIVPTTNGSNYLHVRCEVIQ